MKIIIQLESNHITEINVDPNKSFRVLFILGNSIGQKKFEIRKPNFEFWDQLVKIGFETKDIWNYWDYSYCHISDLLSYVHMIKKNIVYCSINSHFFEHGRAMHIYSNLSKLSNLSIFWVDSPLCPHRYILSKIKKSINNFHKDIIFYVPIGFPFYMYSNFLWKCTDRLLTAYLKALNLDCNLLIISHPIFVSYAKYLKKKEVPVIYDCRDFFSKWDKISKYAIEKEKELIDICDSVIVPTKSLKEEMDGFNLSHKFSIIYNGVPASMVKKCKKRNNPRPKIGFVGHIGYYVNLELVIRIAKKRTDWDFIFVGDDSQINNKVKNSLANCMFIGEVPFDQLNPILCTFDVAIIPFKKMELTDVVFPIKLVEYFAKGIPVVSAPLNELFNLDQSYLIHFAENDNVDDWISKIEKALDDDRHEEFINFANEYTWEDLTKKYLAIIDKLIQL